MGQIEILSYKSTGQILTLKYSTHYKYSTSRSSVENLMSLSLMDIISSNMLSTFKAE